MPFCQRNKNAKENRASDEVIFQLSHFENWSTFTQIYRTFLVPEYDITNSALHIIASDLTLQNEHILASSIFYIILLFSEVVRFFAFQANSN